VADRRRLAAVALAVAVLGTAACGADRPAGPAISVAGDNGGYHGTYLDTSPFTVADVPLTGTDGEPYSIATAEAPLKIVFFGYTKCPDICQVVMSTVAQAVTKLDDADRKKVEVVFVTTDPARDTEKVLGEYLDRFGDDLVGLTGSMDDIVALGDSFKVSIEDGRKLPSGGYEVDHSTYTYGVVGDGAEVIWDSTTSPAEMSADMIKLLKS